MIGAARLQLHYERFLFYGWLIVGVVFVTSLVTAGISAYALGLFFEPMRESLGLSAAALSSIVSVRQVAMALTGPIVGPLIDKPWGARVVMPAGAVAGGLALMAISQVQALWQLILAFGVVFGFSQAMLGGQVVTPVVISKWFIRTRGRALAISAMGFSAGGVVMVPLSQYLISSMGWRGAWVALGALMIIVLAPLTALTIRRQPEDVGRSPDGVKPIPKADTAAPGAGSRGTTDTAGMDIPEEVSFTLREVIRVPAVWLLTGSQMMVSLGLMAVLIHLIPFVTEKGFPSTVAASVMTVVAACAVVGKPIYGFIAERIHVRYVATFGFTLSGLSLGGLLFADNAFTVFLAGILFGLNFGGFVVLINIAWAEYFGRASLGSIRGVFTPVAMLATASSPLLGGFLRDTYGTYDASFVLYTLAWFAGALLIFLARPPKRSVPATSGT